MYSIHNFLFWMFCKEKILRSHKNCICSITRFFWAHFGNWVRLNIRRNKKTKQVNEESSIWLKRSNSVDEFIGKILKQKNKSAVEGISLVGSSHTITKFTAMCTKLICIKLLVAALNWNLRLADTTLCTFTCRKAQFRRRRRRNEKLKKENKQKARKKNHSPENNRAPLRD